MQEFKSRVTRTARRELGTTGNQFSADLHGISTQEAGCSNAAIVESTDENQLSQTALRKLKRTIAPAFFESVAGYRDAMRAHIKEEFAKQSNYPMLRLVLPA